MSKRDRKLHITFLGGDLNAVFLGGSLEVNLKRPRSHFSYELYPLQKARKEAGGPGFTDWEIIEAHRKAMRLLQLIDGRNGY